MPVQRPAADRSAASLRPTDDAIPVDGPRPPHRWWHARHSHRGSPSRMMQPPRTTSPTPSLRRSFLAGKTRPYRMRATRSTPQSGHRDGLRFDISPPSLSTVDDKNPTGPRAAAGQVRPLEGQTRWDDRRSYIASAIRRSRPRSGSPHRQPDRSPARAGSQSTSPSYPYKGMPRRRKSSIRSRRTESASAGCTATPVRSSGAMRSWT